MALVAINWKPSPRQLRQFALAAAAFLLVVAARSYAVQGFSAWVTVLTAMAAGVGLGGLVRPRSLRPLYLALMIVTFPVGWIMSHVILAVIYYGVFTVVALVFRLLGRDALQRRLDPSVASYWQEKAMPRDLRSYFQTF